MRSVSTALLLVFMNLVFSASILRYGFDAGSVKMQDLISYAFASLIILSVLAAFIGNRHVRVYMVSKKPRVFEKQFAKILSSLPFFLIAALSIPAVTFSWSVLEGSLEPGGMGGLYLVKSLVPVSFGLIAIFLCLSTEDDRQ